MSSAPEAARAPSRAARSRSARMGQAVKGVATALLVFAVGAFLFLAVGPRVLGYQTSTMLTGSMSPLIDPGDVVVTVPVPVGDLKVGDVITYHIPVEDRRVETHRIVGIDSTPDGKVTVQTKGDANTGRDPWTAAFGGETVDRHVATVPYLGTVIRALRQPLVANALMYGAPAVLVIGALFSIWRKDPESPAEGTPDVPAEVRA